MFLRIRRRGTVAIVSISTKFRLVIPSKSEKFCRIWHYSGRTRISVLVSAKCSIKRVAFWYRTVAKDTDEQAIEAELDAIFADSNRERFTTGTTVSGPRLHTISIQLSRCGWVTLACPVWHTVGPFDGWKVGGIQ